MRIKYCILVTIIIMSFSANLYSQEPQADTINKWYIPTHVRIQFAGNIGMFSAGPSWTFLKNNIELAYSIGYVPEFAARRDIYITAIKGIYTPKLDININETTTIKPLSVGAVFTYTFGDRYSKYQDTNRYPNGYYWWNISYRIGLLYVAEIYTKINQKHLKGLSVYFEASFWDLYMFSQFDNSNNSYLNLWDTTTFGLGTKVFF